MGWYFTSTGSGEVSWANGAEHNHYVYDATSKITQASNAFSTVNRTYDEDNRLKTDEQILLSGVVDKTVNYNYDAASENIRMHVDDGNGYDRNFCYDAMGRFSTISDHSTGATWFTYTYDAASNVTGRANALNGVTESVPRGTAAMTS